MQPRKPTKKMTDTLKWVVTYLLRNKYLPTYQEVAEHFKIGKTTAYMRLKRYRDIMRKQ